ncbi:hypothetical protein B0J11DRAFT_240582 [Dendryphion nanum]|uniref:Uncharacterized protein n=1 Tax=Dendryphion nanum TaxID=256645 RepID=A0A9P9CXL6_9PLEO|nr:hypothetical protein B0J11DRAFT_240582 [Dendryphion nanum]
MLCTRHTFQRRYLHLRPFSTSATALKFPQGKLSPADSKIDFLGIEKDWHARWEARGTKIQEERDAEHDHPLVPFYLNHIRRPTMLGTLQSMLAKRRIGAAHKCKTSMVEKIIFHYDASLSYSQKEAIDSYSQMYGRDIVRTAVIFSQSSDADTHSPIDEQSIMHAQGWLEGVWEAVRVAHISYDDTSICSGELVDLEAHDDPDMVDKFVDSMASDVESFVHVPPNNPRALDMDEDACALWLATQEAISAMTRQSEIVDSHKIQSRLSRLAGTIVECEGGDGQCWMDRSAHYHSTRILLSLMALFTPSFAEACWLALHYGHNQWQDGEINGEKKRGSSLSYEEKMMREDLVEYGYYDLPRQNDPRPLSSIFSQPFPVLESSKIIKLLIRVSTESELRVLRGGEVEHK